jgi:hypothetical protein
MRSGLCFSAFGGFGGFVLYYEPLPNLIFFVIASSFMLHARRPHALGISYLPMNSSTESCNVYVSHIPIKPFKRDS